MCIHFITAFDDLPEAAEKKTKIRENKGDERFSVNQTELLLMGIRWIAEGDLEPL